ncbi:MULTISPECIES: Holliday junction resolvase Hjc [Acidianus]|uniref:Endonuclease n=1 Tax=Candidatus Acidianus copahuensis TaxID=1160895 RepID=A0A031LRS6_9CREN|nr:MULTISPECIES: Holliday junction resolvase Hjc [Acidianus]EZQ11067.1 endonuclease [Candidatus Acidianus copahuensis]NON62734.1 endonuclease [Acidianus sp. RZ1]
MNKDIGRRAERELVNILRNYGFKSVRIPTSNSSSNPLPDVFAIYGKNLLSIEVKSTWEKKVKVKELQIKKIIDFITMFPLKGRALIVVKFKGREWKVTEVETVNDIVVSEENSIPLHEYILRIINVELTSRESVVMT